MEIDERPPNDAINDVMEGDRYPLHIVFDDDGPKVDRGKKASREAYVKEREQLFHFA